MKTMLWGCANARSFIVMALLLIVLQACSKGKNAGSCGEVGAVTPRIVKGVVRDKNGNPVPGATIEIQRITYYSSVKITTDDQGCYAVKLDDGNWRVIANISKRYNNITYCLALKPEGDNEGFYAGDGAIRNFIFDPAGSMDVSGGRISYGGILKLEITDGGLRNGTRFEVIVTLTPTGKLITGVDGEVLTLTTGTLTANGSRITGDIGGVPMGFYTATAVYKLGGQTYKAVTKVENTLPSQFYGANTVTFAGGLLGCNEEYYTKLEITPDT